MFSILVTLLVYLLVLSLLYWAATQIFGSLNVPAPIQVIVKVLFVVIACAIILGVFTDGLPVFRWK